MITFQRQPTLTSCVCTCIAMIVGLPANEVMEKFHTEYYDKGMTVRDIFHHYKVPFKSYDTLDRNVMVDEDGAGVFLVTVPSLNIEGGTHQILFVMYGDDSYSIFDPIMGHEDKKYYTASTPEGLSRRIGGYSIDAWIPGSHFKTGA